MVVDLDLVLNAVEEAVHQGQRGIFKRLVAGALIAQPDLTGPEAAGPLVVLALGIDVMNTGMVLAMVCIQRQILPHKSHGGIQRLFGLRLRQDFIGRKQNAGLAVLFFCVERSGTRHHNFYLLS